MKAFLGTGLLGSNFVKAMRKRGEEVQVWNRTAAKAKALEEVGAKAFDNPADAVKGAFLVHLTLKDDASVNEVLEAARDGLAPGAVIIDHTTTSKDGAIQRTKEWKEKGFFYQHAPVFMGPVNALESSGFMLLSGDEALIGRIEPELQKMTGKILRFGSEVGKAAAMKLVGNAFLVCFTAGIRETLCLSKALGLSVTDLSSLFDAWNPGTLLQPRLKRMTAGDYTNPSWELAMARKDTGLFIDAAQKVETELTLLPVIASLMDSWIEKGYGNNDWTVIAKDCV
ncbi:NAD(P)-dependent oxidoreductase [Flavisolibacter ginsenosidimutans]|uniref:NAD(P)-dependent oxidoreductase n=1 Tax=Flavisolibacter ginsenosidimutans TaxID=661481 RepID=A0A5B8UHY7_9BACT|nr:NAD(P)-dependent oxidoreductase [Flavisolibacter ginsenosidimutans]QEC56271.1 NAD(P)-dependent oxidoreductase [Flavisolibacter ginsenosidimutans]